MVLENVGKGSHIILYIILKCTCNQEKTYSGLENQGRPAVLGGQLYSQCEGIVELDVLSGNVCLGKAGAV